MDVAKALHRLWPACLLISVLACRPWAHGANQLPASDSLMATISSGRRLLSSGDYLQAEKLFQQALQNSQKTGNVGAAVMALDGLAGLYVSTSRLSEAEKQYLLAIALLEKQPQSAQPALLANLLNNLADACWQQGKLIETRRALERSLRLSDANPAVSPADLAAPLGNLGILLVQTASAGKRNVSCCARPHCRNPLRIGKDLRSLSMPSRASMR